VRDIQWFDQQHALYAAGAKMGLIRLSSAGDFVEDFSTFCLINEEFACNFIRFIFINIVLQSISQNFIRILFAKLPSATKKIDWSCLAVSSIIILLK